MEDPAENPRNNPMALHFLRSDHPEEQRAGTDDSPKFGRLLIVLMIAVILIAVVTFASEAYFSR